MQCFKAICRGNCDQKQANSIVPIPYEKPIAFRCFSQLKFCILQVNLDRSCELSAPRVVYPLCYRHDLCFWVNEIESEDVILAAIRHCCNDVVHSVRLLRILRHEESKLLSFCYRIIYSRCDGPLSHNETVELQNRLRLLLLDLKFELR